MYASAAPRTHNVIADLAAHGRHDFTSSELRSALGISREATRQVLSRLAVKGEIASSARGFYVIVPPEYWRLGCLPTDQFVLELMEYRNTRYFQPPEATFGPVPNITWLGCARQWCK